jgi:hypothetical protein
MRIGARIVTVLAVVVCAAAGCNPTPVKVTARRLAAIPHGEIRHIAVLPFATGENVRPHELAVGEEPLVEPPAETVMRAVDDELRKSTDWQITDGLVTGEAFRRLYGEVRAPTRAEALAVGKLLAVDAVLIGQVREFEERVGAELAAQKPARVVFAVELIRIPSDEAVWQAVYAETQTALTENLWNISGFLQARGRWVRAGELAGIGAQKVAAEMHVALFGTSTARAGTPP